MKICEQLILQFLLLAVNISFWVLVSALNSIGLLQRPSLRFKKLSLGCLVVGSCFIWKKKNKKKLAGMVTRWNLLSLFVPLVVIPYHLLSLLLFVVTRCHSLSLLVPLVVPLVIRCHSLSLVVPLVVIRCTTSLSFYKRSNFD